jgi:hypothetical protein
MLMRSLRLFELWVQARSEYCVLVKWPVSRRRLKYD